MIGNGSMNLIKSSNTTTHEFIREIHNEKSKKILTILLDDGTMIQFTRKDYDLIKDQMCST